MVVVLAGAIRSAFGCGSLAAGLDEIREPAANPAHELYGCWMALIYMLAIGLATATAVRVGNAVGRRDRAGLARAGWVGLGLGITLMLCLTPVLYGSSGAIARIYTADAAVVAIAAPGLVLAA